MDKNAVETLVDGLKSTDSSKVLASLMKIRTKVLISDHGMRLLCECSGLSLLVALLRKPNEKILDAALSGLGNCCMREDIILAVGKLNIAQPLVLILKSISKDSIVGRSCRLMGNLAQNIDNAEKFHEAGAVPALVNIIENVESSTTHATLVMAIRAIRFLWMVKNRRKEMLQEGAVRAVTVLLISACESAELIKPLNNIPSSKLNKNAPSKAQEDLFIGLLKCLGLFTALADYRCAEQLQGDGRGYWCIVALVKDFESLALHCLSNLCHVSSARPVLGTTGAVCCLVDYLVKNPDVDLWPNHCAVALSLLCRESVNRQRLRLGSGLRLLLVAAHSPKHASHAVPALLQFVFDDIGFQILLNEGLINLVVEELKKYLLTMKSEHLCPENTYKPKNKNTLPIKTASFKKSYMSEADQLITSLEIEPKSPAQIENDMQIVIERDNVMISFSEYGSDMSGVDQSDTDEEDCNIIRRNSVRNYKRKRSRMTHDTIKKKAKQADKLTHARWSYQNVHCTSSAERSTLFIPGTSNSTSPSRGDLSPWSAYSESGHSSNTSFDSPSLTRWDGTSGSWSPERSSSGYGESILSPQWKWPRPEWSPNSVLSICSSPQSSVYDKDSSGSEHSGRYSPVCNDMEDEDMESESHSTKDNLIIPSKPSGINQDNDASMDCGISQTEVDGFNYVFDNEDVQEECLDTSEKSLSFVGSKTHLSCILVLISRISHTTLNNKTNIWLLSTPEQSLTSKPTQQPKSEITVDPGTPTANSMSADNLVTKDFLDAILEYIFKCRRPYGRAYRVIARLISNPTNLMRILQYNVAQKLYAMAQKPQHCFATCKDCRQLSTLSMRLTAQLTILAESEYGIGEISYQLLKGTSEVKQILAVTLPYIISSYRPLKKFLIDCKLLDILIGCCNEAGATAFSMLATNLEVRNPKSLSGQASFEDFTVAKYEPSFDGLTGEDIVSFELDDLSIVEADKKFLCRHSDVFNAMLTGTFKESTENRVRLPSVSKTSFEYLLVLVRFCTNGDGVINAFPLPKDLDTALETLLLADRFLFEHIRYLLAGAIIKFKFTPCCADKIYMWSLTDGVGFLCIESVAYILTGKMAESERTKLFTSILQSRFRQQWIDDIEQILLRHAVSKSELHCNDRSMGFPMHANIVSAR